MGGLGSGRRNRSRRSTTEQCWKVDINQLQRAGCLHPGWLGVWNLSSEAVGTAPVAIRAECERVVLHYRIRTVSGERYTVPHPDFISISPRGSFVVIIDAKDRPHHLSAILIERASPLNGHHRRKTGKRSSH